MLTQPEIDRAKLRFYKEFHESNRDLYKRDLQEYISQQNRYVERKIQEWKINMRGEINGR